GGGAGDRAGPQTGGCQCSPGEAGGSSQQGKGVDCLYRGGNQKGFPRPFPGSPGGNPGSRAKTADSAAAGLACRTEEDPAGGEGGKAPGSRHGPGAGGAGAFPLLRKDAKPVGTSGPGSTPTRRARQALRV